MCECYTIAAVACYLYLQKFPQFRPAHAYTFSFEPNPNWSSFYAYSPEIKKYFEDFADKHSLRPWIQLNTRVLSATWVEEKGICEYRGTSPQFNDEDEATQH